MLRINANQGQLIKMMVDYPGPRRVLLEVLQPLSHGKIPCKLRFLCVCLNYNTPYMHGTVLH